MSIYGFRVPKAGHVSRAKGHSAVAAAAYQAREKLQDERLGKQEDYAKAYGGEDLAFAGIYAPKDAPDWATDREQLWNHVEAFETRSNARLARRYQFDLPHELTEEQNRYLVQDFIRENFTRKGYVADVAIHRPGEDGDERNIHAHLMVTDRPLDGDEFASHKDRDIIKRDELNALRESWAHHLSRHLRRHGFELEAERMAHGHLTNAAQREKAIERGDWEYAELKAAPAQIHMGKDAAALERRGVETDKGDHNRAVDEWHEAASSLRHEQDRLRQMESWQVERDQLAADMRAARTPEPTAQPEMPPPSPPSARGEFADLAATHAAVSADRQADKQAARAVIGEAWRAADDPLHFAILLGDSGYSLAENDHGRFVAVDSRGAVHYLSREAIGDDARTAQQDIAATFNAGKGLTVPSVDELRQRVREEQTDDWRNVPRPDRAGDYAALQPDTITREQQRMKEQAEWRAAWFAEQRERMAGNATVWDINAAWREVQENPRTTLAAALDDRGLILARVSEQEADDSRAARIKAQIEVQLSGVTESGGKVSRAMQAGELCAVDGHGRAYVLTPRIIDADEYELAAHLAKLDADQPSMTEARTALAAERAQRRDAWQDQHRQEQADRLSVIADIRVLREAYREADSAGTPREQGAALVQAIEDKGFLVARVTPEEAETSRYNADTAEAQGNWRARLEVGDVLAVNEWGRAYRLDSVTLNDPEAGVRLCGIDQAPLLSLSQAREAADYFRSQGQGATWLGSEGEQVGGGAGLGIIMGGITEGLESFAGGIERFLFGSSSPRDESQRPAVLPQPPKTEGARNREKIHQQDPIVRARDPETPRYHFGLDPEIIEELRRQREARERDDDRRGRDR